MKKLPFALAALAALAGFAFASHADAQWGRGVFINPSVPATVYGPSFGPVQGYIPTYHQPRPSNFLMQNYGPSFLSTGSTTYYSPYSRGATIITPTPFGGTIIQQQRYFGGTNHFGFTPNGFSGFHR